MRRIHAGACFAERFIIRHGHCSLRKRSLAGTWKQYSKKAIPQLTKITFQRAELRYLRWPYQAKVMKRLEIVNSRMVRTLFQDSENRSVHGNMCGMHPAIPRLLELQAIDQRIATVRAELDSFPNRLREAEGKLN